LEHLDHCLNCNSKNFRSFQKTSAMMSSESGTYSFVQCNDCELVFLNPRLPAQDLDRFYGPEYLPYRGPGAWGKFGFLVKRDLRRTDKERVSLVQKNLDKASEEVVVDIGCGKPSFLRALSDRTPSKLIGLDFSDHGWEGRPEDWPGIELITGDPANTDLPQAPSCITMWHYLEHDYDPPRTLRRLHSIAQKEAKLIIEVPNIDCLPRKWQGEHWAGYHTPRHTLLYSPKTLKDLLERNGWRLQSLKTSGSLDPYALYWMGKMEKKGIDWSGNMEKRFWPFLMGKILTAPLFALQRFIPLGVMTAVAVRDET
jgi:hypothetical protein